MLQAIQYCYIIPGVLLGSTSIYHPSRAGCVARPGDLATVVQVRRLTRIAYRRTDTCIRCRREIGGEDNEGSARNAPHVRPAGTKHHQAKQG